MSKVDAKIRAATVRAEVAERQQVRDQGSSRIESTVEHAAFAGLPHMPARQDRRARRGTGRARAVRVPEAHALAGHAVEVGRMHVGIALGPGVGPGLIVRQGQQDIGRPAPSAACGGAQ